MTGRINSFSETAYTVSFEFRSVDYKATMAQYRYLVAGVAKLVATWTEIRGDGLEHFAHDYQGQDFERLR